MTISFQIKYRDLIAFNFYDIYHSLVFRGILILLMAIGAYPNWRAASDVASERTLLYQIVLFIILELIPILFVYLMSVLTIFIVNLGKMNKTVVTACTFTFDEEVIKTKSVYSYSELRWAAVQKFKQTRTHIFLYIKQHGALVIPKRVFESNDACDLFSVECQSRIEKGHHKQQNST